MAVGEDLDTVLMRHPGIPGDAVPTARSAFEHHWIHSGWVLADPEPSAAPDPPRPTEIKTPEAPAAAGASALPDNEEPPATSRRRASKEGAE
jgi:hypothetical protein